MPIIGKPIIIPRKELDRRWVLLFHSEAPSLDSGPTLFVKLVPYNEAGELGEPFDLPPVAIFERAKSDPLAAKIYAQILKWVELYEHECREKGLIK